jgi:hypothetical protein
MVRIRYGPNQQGIAEVEIQPQLVEDLTKKNKRPERKKSNPKPKVVPTPSEKKVWKAHEEAPKSTTTPIIKKKRKVWMPKKTPVLTPPSTENPSSSKQ